MPYSYEIFELFVAYYNDHVRYMELDQMIEELGPIKVCEFMDAIAMFDHWLIEQRLMECQLHLTNQLDALVG